MIITVSKWDLKSAMSSIIWLAYFSRIKYKALVNIPNTYIDECHKFFLYNSALPITLMWLSVMMTVTQRPITSHRHTPLIHQLYTQWQTSQSQAHASHTPALHSVTDLTSQAHASHTPALHSVTDLTFCLTRTVFWTGSRLKPTICNL